mmetsp:Transcript_40331/g.84386  ORF Transcript_40331/g.84386 Transcript_40331/m.84386 type:complete len:101 (-) Transcript_40331:425-727(-)
MTCSTAVFNSPSQRQDSYLTFITSLEDVSSRKIPGIVFGPKAPRLDSSINIVNSGSISTNMGHTKVTTVHSAQPPITKLEIFFCHECTCSFSQCSLIPIV